MTDQQAPIQRAGWLSRVLTPPVAALQFLTLAPPIVRRMFTAQEMGRAVGYFPLVGALLGGLLALFDRGLGLVFPQSGAAGSIASVLTLSASVLATGALHLDGFLDACDGLFGGHTPEKRLEIMHDERVGAFGLAGGVLLLLLKWSALVASTNRVVALLLALTLSRWAISLAIATAPYARAKGLGRDIKDHTGGTQVILSTLIALAVALLAGRWLGLVALLAAALTTWLAVRLALARLPGLTGDVYGAISEGVEAVVLLVYAAAIP
jgi:adenosylcobinamide-GDP ribazoletransferase